MIDIRQESLVHQLNIEADIDYDIPIKSFVVDEENVDHNPTIIKSAKGKLQIKVGRKYLDKLINNYLNSLKLELKNIFKNDNMIY